MHSSITRVWKLTCTTIALAAFLAPALSAQPMRQVAVQVTSQQNLAATGDWNQKSENVWQRDIDGVQAELAFGFAALERALDHIESEIDRLGEPASRQQQLDLLELKLRRDELLDAARQMLAPHKSTQTSQQTICGGQAEFTHWYGQTWFYTYSVRSTSSFGMPGPVSPYTKTAYARAKACNTSGTPFCDEPAPVSASTTSYAVSAEVVASRGPATGAAREAFGYVLVIGACTEVRSFSTSVPS